jgi:hypothetical protein
MSTKPELNKRNALIYSFPQQTLNLGGPKMFLISVFHVNVMTGILDAFLPAVSSSYVILILSIDIV